MVMEKGARLSRTRVPRSGGRRGADRTAEITRIDTSCRKFLEDSKNHNSRLCLLIEHLISL
jgi:hypothetical protein